MGTEMRDMSQLSYTAKIRKTLYRGGAAGLPFINSLCKNALIKDKYIM